MKNKILVVEQTPTDYSRIIEHLGEISTDLLDFHDNPSNYKLVQFCGGDDVNPFLYKDSSPQGYCRFNYSRDLLEMEVWRIALRNNIPMTGICRGMQFINVMNGGRMLHHITNHALAGQHSFVLSKTGECFPVTSTHHQMAVPSELGYVVGETPRQYSKYYLGEWDEEERWSENEVESLWFPETSSFGVQFHPEKMYYKTRAYQFYQEAVKDLIELSVGDFHDKYI